MDPTSFEYSIGSTCYSLALTMFYMAFLSLLIGCVPLVLGTVRYKWAATMISMSAGFMIAGVMLKWLFAGTPVQPGDVTGFNPIGIWIMMFCLTPVAVTKGAKLLDKYLRLLRQTRKEDVAAPEELPDPIDVAREHTPDMLDEVQKAMQEIRQFTSIDAQVMHPDDASAIIMVDRRLPAIMRSYKSAMGAMDVGMGQEVARMAMRSVIDIGEIAKSARRRIAADRKLDLDNRSRHVSSSRQAMNGVTI